MLKNKNQIIENNNILNKDINIFINKVNDIIEKLNIVKNNIEIYYEINKNIIDNINNKNINYEILYMMNSINNNNIHNDIKNIINEKDINDQFNKIMNIYKLMNINNIEGINNNNNEYKPKDISKNIVKEKNNILDTLLALLAQYEFALKNKETKIDIKLDIDTIEDIKKKVNKTKIQDTIQKIGLQNINKDSYSSVAGGIKKMLKVTNKTLDSITKIDMDTGVQKVKSGKIRVILSKLDIPDELRDLVNYLKESGVKLDFK